MVRREFVGYGERPPAKRWPGDARIALNFVVNYEEGGEDRFEDGCNKRETVGEVASPVPTAPPQRDLANESMFEYGSRAGVWRLIRLFDRYRLRVTFFAAAVALERNPAVGTAITSRGHDICAHGDRWQEHFLLGLDEEKAAIHRAASTIERICGQAPAGWYCRYGPSVNTRRLAAESGRFLYDSDAYNDDLPYYRLVDGKPWLVVPYSLDTNDMCFWRGNMMTGEEFFVYLRDTFDYLYEEGEACPRMMSVGLHCRIVGRAGRTSGLERFVRYVSQRPETWITTRGEIARWWLENHAPPAVDSAGH